MTKLQAKEIELLFIYFLHYAFFVLDSNEMIYGTLF